MGRANEGFLKKIYEIEIETLYQWEEWCCGPDIFLYFCTLLSVAHPSFSAVQWLFRGFHLQKG